LTLAQRRVLDEKERFVEKHRGRLVRDAERARSRAVEQLRQAITAVEEARAEAAECVAAERWAIEFPGDDANAASLRLDQTKGGRVPKAIPELKALTGAPQLFAWLREDAAWLDQANEKPKRGEPDPHFEPIWEDSDEGKEAIRRANKRIAEGLKPRNVHRAGWEQ
jgi:hypothetical protein